jgi:fumarate hydratase, class II
MMDMAKGNQMLPASDISTDQASRIAHLAIDKDLTLKQVALQSGVDEGLFDRIVVPANMTRPGTADTARTS